MRLVPTGMLLGETSRLCLLSCRLVFEVLVEEFVETADGTECVNDDMDDVTAGILRDVTLLTETIQNKLI